MTQTVSDLPHRIVHGLYLYSTHTHIISCYVEPAKLDLSTISRTQDLGIGYHTRRQTHRAGRQKQVSAARDISPTESRLILMSATPLPVSENFPDSAHPPHPLPSSMPRLLLYQATQLQVRAFLCFIRQLLLTTELIVEDSVFALFLAKIVTLPLPPATNSPHHAAAVTHGPRQTTAVTHGPRHAPVIKSPQHTTVNKDPNYAAIASDHHPADHCLHHLSYAIRHLICVLPWHHRRLCCT